MIPELGHLALIIAFGLAVVQGIVPLVGAARRDRAWMAVARPAARAHFGFLLVAFASLMYCFASNDFSVLYVAQNSNSSLPLYYRLPAVWGAHEGSMLLWVTILGLWTWAVSFFSRRLPLSFVARVLGVMGLVSTGFLAFLLFTSNPFARLSPVPPNGANLNPLLQDPGMIMHPPILYTGYVGFCVAFAFAITALLEGRLDSVWARWTRPWTIFAWTFLTLGIAGGSWWSYYELGWGGWWFWDPVENASFMPWLVGTALIHSLAATEKRGAFKNWTVLLAICAFALSLLGTFLVRSGVLTSVHAFAVDPRRGIFVLGLLALVVGSSLILYAWRAPRMLTSGSYAFLSRETLLLANSILLVVATAAVLLGTTYPLIVEVLGGKISVGAPYFNTVFIPLMVPLLIILGLGVTAHWKNDEWRRIGLHVRTIAIACVVLGGLVALMLSGSKGLKAGLAVALGLWIAWTTFDTVIQRLRRHQGVPRSIAGMTLAHFGLAVTLIGVAAASNFSTSAHVRMGVGDSVKLSGYTFTLADLKPETGPDYQATDAVIKVSRDGQPVTTLNTQKRTYVARQSTTTEAGIEPGLTRDLYVTLGDPLGHGQWSMRLHYKPFVRWIWGGAFFMALGGLLAATDRRYRLREAKREAPVLDPGTATES